MNKIAIIIEVYAGLLVNQPMAEYTKIFNITSEDLEDKTGETVMKVYGYAQEYARNLWNPNRVNWVSTNWTYM